MEAEEAASAMVRGDHDPAGRAGGGGGGKGGRDADRAAESRLGGDARGA